MQLLIGKLIGKKKIIRKSTRTNQAAMQPSARLVITTGRCHRYISHTPSCPLAMALESARCNGSDRQVILEAVKQNGCALGYASEKLRNDPDVVMAAVEQYGCALKYASEELKNELKIVLKAIKNDEDALEWVSQELMDQFSAELVHYSSISTWINFEHADKLDSADDAWVKY